LPRGDGSAIYGQSENKRPTEVTLEMADGNPLIIGNANTASSPGAATVLSRNETAPSTVFVARNLNAGDGVRGGAGTGGTGVEGISDSGTGVSGFSASGAGVWGASISGPGVQGYTDTFHAAVEGWAGPGVGVEGFGGAGIGVRGQSDEGVGVHGFSGLGGVSGAVGVLGQVAVGGFGYAGVFIGKVQVTGDLEVFGQKNFKIDHPLDPGNRYLVHTCVESSEMKNVYDGVARLEEDGAAWVELPEWFEALNGDFRYQLTAVGRPAPQLHVAEEIADSRFKIAGGEDGTKVCWQVTGTRRDRWAAANPVEVEPEKPEAERGRYLEPGLYDQPEEKKVTIGPLAETLRAAATPRAGVAAMEEFRRRIEETRQRIEELRRQKHQQQNAPPETT
jgi:hypothetical protein